MASLTRRFVSAKRLFRDLSEFRGKLIEHQAHLEFANRTLGVMLNEFAYEF